jgi:GMP synthase-like glutamine amidotransferase
MERFRRSSKRPDVLIVDYDVAYLFSTQRALHAVGATTVTRLAEEITAEEVRDIRPRSLFLGASSLGTPHRTLSEEIIFNGVPVLGICNGAQIIGRALGASTEKMPGRETGIARYSRAPGTESFLEAGLPAAFPVVMEHDYEVVDLPSTAVTLGSTELCRTASFETWTPGPLFGLQYHPEFPGTAHADNILSRFVWLSRIHAVRRLFRSRTADRSAAGRMSPDTRSARDSR